MAVKLEQFKGIAPKIAPEQLGDGLAQIALNCKLDSGDAIPFPEPLIVGNTGRTGTVQTIYPLVNPDTGDLVWMSWEDVVDIATPAFEPVVAEQRFYYTGDGVPKVTTYELATSGGPPYPYDYYQLGLPLPTTKPEHAATSFAAKTISSVARDSGGIVTFVTSTAHGLRTGMVAAIKGFTYYACSFTVSGQTVTVTLTGHGLVAGSTVFLTKTTGTFTDGAYTISNVTANTFDVVDPGPAPSAGNVKLDTRAYNTTGAEVIVVDDTTFKMFLPGFEQSTYAASGGSVELAGQTYARTYAYTWYTPWGEESVASDPSDDLIIKEGQTVTVSNLPSAPPSVPTKNFIRGIRLYRTLAGFRETDYYLIQTLWFPQNTARVQRVGSVVTVTMQEPHNFLVGDRFKLTGCTNASIDVTDGIVTDTTDAYTFSYASAGTAIADTADTTGVLYHDCAESLDDDARYWGLSTFNFTDDFSSKNLTDSLVSDEWIAPPEDLEGLTVIQNNILAGFVRNSLYLSEPDQPHAWPEANIKTLDQNIVAIRALSGIGAVILTEKQPWILTGSDPANMTLQKVDAYYPCISARGAVSMSYGVLYPTYEGLALYSPGGGARLATENIYNADTWVADYDPSTFVGVYYDNSYFAAHSAGSVVYMYEQQGGGSFVKCDTVFTAAYSDVLNGAVYIAVGTAGDVYQWDNPNQVASQMQWKSKRMVAAEYSNLGAARVKGNFSDVSQVIEDIAENFEASTEVFSAPLGLTFTLWANGTEVFSEQVYDEEIFRLPKGYRADNFEVSVEGDIRVKAIHLGQNPLSLKEV